MIQVINGGDSKSMFDSLTNYWLVNKIYKIACKWVRCSSHDL